MGQLTTLKVHMDRHNYKYEMCESSSEEDTKTNIRIQPIVLNQSAQFQSKKYLHRADTTEMNNIKPQVVSCSFCSNSFVGNAELQKHIENSHGSSKVIALKQLVKLQANDHKPFKCLKCNREFCKQYYLDQHAAIHNIECYQCEHCPKNYTRKDKLSRHLKVHNSIKYSEHKSINCRFCEKVFRLKGQLNEHLLTHIGLRPFQCEKCHKSFGNSSNLRRHDRIHTGIKPYTCKLCNAQFSHSSNLQVHLAKHTGEWKFACNLCEKKFLELSKFQEHKRSHSKESPFKCRRCPRTFRYRSTFSRHCNKHRIGGLLECKYCSSFYPSTRILEKHIRFAHTSVLLEKYECDVCGKIFSRYSQISEHMQLHVNNEISGQQTLSCSMCDAQFTAQTNLQRHIKSHSFPKPFECAICLKAYSRQYDLRKHVIRAHIFSGPMS